MARYRQIADFSEFSASFLVRTRQDAYLLGAVSDDVLGAAVRAFCLTGFLDRQVDLRMGIPQVHAGHRAGQWDIVTPHFISMLRICRDQILINCSCSFRHWSHRSLDGIAGL